MAPPKKKTEQLGLEASPKPKAQSPKSDPRPDAAPTLPPKFLEYKPLTANDRWTVEQFDSLAAYFEFPAGSEWVELMRCFHAYAEPDTRRWFLVRRLYGISPLIPPDGTAAEDLRCLTREELQSASGLTAGQLSEELVHLRLNWAKECERNRGQKPEVRRQEPREELALSDDLLKRFDFDRDLFEVQVTVLDKGMDAQGQLVDKFVTRARSPEKNRQEMDWFCARLMRTEWQKMLEEPMAASLARSALVNELYLHRFDSEMMKLMPNTAEWRSMSKSRQDVEKIYAGQMKDLADKFPDMGVTAKVGSRAIVSDLNLAHRQYYGNADNRLWDGMHTAQEIQWLHRTSEQLPKPKYRLSWVIAAIEARNELLNANFRSLLPKSVLKRLDRGYERGIEEAQLEDPQPKVDLEKGVIPGEPGVDEFEDFKIK